MKKIFVILVSGFLSFASAEDKMKMSYSNEELPKIIEAYAKASGQKFVIDPTVRGKVTILNPDQISLEEAFNQLSAALALNGFAIVKQGDLMIVRNARSAQRDLLEVYLAKPPMRPERMVTYIYTVKNYPASEILRQVRVFTSSYGEVSANENTNQLIFGDWSSNLNRVDEILKEIDRPVDATTAKVIAAGRKQRLESRKNDSMIKKPVGAVEKKETTTN